MADIRNDFVGIRSPNPFWLASAPPTDKAYNVERAFKAGWGGVVWKTLGEEGPPIVNVNGPRYGAIWGADRRLLGLNNIELITDRDLQTNLREMKQVKKNWPDRALIASIMVPCEENAWKAILPLVEETECDGIELNFGCPHGMSERGMRVNCLHQRTTISTYSGTWPTAAPMPRSLMPCGQPKLSSMPSAPVSSTSGRMAFQASSSHGTMIEATTARSGQSFLTCLISRRLVCRSRSVMSSMLLKPRSRRSAPQMAP